MIATSLAPTISGKVLVTDESESVQVGESVIVFHANGFIIFDVAIL